MERRDTAVGEGGVVGEGAPGAKGEVLHPPVGVNGTGLCGPFINRRDARRERGKAVSQSLCGNDGQRGPSGATDADDQDESEKPHRPKPAHALSPCAADISADDYLP